jgi:hypothetical protein
MQQMPDSSLIAAAHQSRFFRNRERILELIRLGITADGPEDRATHCDGYVHKASLYKFPVYKYVQIRTEKQPELSLECAQPECL